MTDGLEDDDLIITNTVEGDDTVALTEPKGESEVSVPQVTLEEDGAVAPSPTAEDEDNDVPTNAVLFPEGKIDFRGEAREALVSRIADTEVEIGANNLDTLVRTTGSWENIMWRALSEQSLEEMRIQEALSDLSESDKKALASRYKDPTTGKTLLRAAPIIEKIAAGTTKTLTGDAALTAFEFQEKGGGWRILLYNSGISIDIIVPTGNDLQTLLSNCWLTDRQLGSSSGAHYFTYEDVVYKRQIWEFIRPLIVNSSCTDWRKSGRLQSVIKIPDLHAIIMNIAAICYKDGFDGFVIKCTRPKNDDGSPGCRHTETINANLFDMILTRFSTLSRDSIDFMSGALMTNPHNTMAQIAKYQADLGLEGERITFGNVTFTMRIPSLTEHMEGGRKFLGDIINEIEADNTDGRYEQVGLRYIRTFLPWIASVEKKGSQDEVIKTSDERVIVRELEKLDQDDEKNNVRETLRKYIDKIQLTYVGYPVTKCPTCDYVADTPSGMWTFDPFTAFFTLALRYLKVA